MSKKQFLIVLGSLLIFLLFSKLLGIVLFLIYVWHWSNWNKKKRIVITALIGIYPLFVALLILGVFPIRSYIVSGNSMFPTLETNQKFIAKMVTSEDIIRGDLIVHKFPTNRQVSTIRRVIGLPGESIEIKDGKVFINGKYLDESSYLDELNTEAGKFVIEKNLLKIPRNAFVVMGDNRKESSDSREWGFVNADDIEGIFLLKY